MQSILFATLVSVLIVSSSFAAPPTAAKPAAKAAGIATPKPTPKAKAPGTAPEKTPATQAPDAQPSAVTGASPEVPTTDPVPGAALPGGEPPPVTDLLTPLPQAAVFRNWGFSLSLNIPHPIFAELEHRFTPKWSMGLGAGGFALNSLKIGNLPVKLSIGAIDARLRWYPWSKSFYMGAALGVQRFSGQATDSIPVTVSGTTVNIPTTVKVDINSLYVTPQLGWLWIWDSGFLLGFDLGVQVPISPKTTLEITSDNRVANVALALVQETAQFKKLEKDITDAGDKIGKIPLPAITVFRIGWMF